MQSIIQQTGLGGIAPFESPVGYGLDVRHCFNCMEQMQFLCQILDICVNEEGVAVDVFDCDLEAVEASVFGSC